MSVKIRPYINGGWEVDIRVRRPDGTVDRERRKAPISSNTSALRRWAEEREREFAKLKPPEPPVVVVEQVPVIPTLREFAPRFIEGYAKANQEKPSSIAGKESILRVHLIPELGDRRLDAITTEDVQCLKVALNRNKKAPKTVNNTLTVLATLLKTAVDWKVLQQMPCVVKMLKVPVRTMEFHDFDAYEKLVAAAVKEGETARLLVLLGGQAGLRCGELMALEWRDIDLLKKQLTVARSDWKGHVTAPKGGSIRHLPLTERLVAALRQARHLRGSRVVCQDDGSPLTQKVVQGIVRRVAQRANVKAGVHILRHTFCSHLAMRGAPAGAIQKLAGHQHLSTTMRYMHLSPAAIDAAIRLLDGSGLAGAVEK